MKRAQELVQKEIIVCEHGSQTVHLSKNLG